MIRLCDNTRTKEGINTHTYQAMDLVHLDTLGKRPMIGRGSYETQINLKAHDNVNKCMQREGSCEINSKGRDYPGWASQSINCGDHFPSTKLH